MRARVMALCRVGEATIAWDQARRDAARLRSERASIKCEHAHEAEYNEHGYLTLDGRPPCWFISWQDQHGRDRVLPSEDWCEPCRQRQAVHVAYTKAVAKRQGLLRGLQRMALTARKALAGDPRPASQEGGEK